MKHTNSLVYVIAVGLGLTVLGGCERPSQSRADTKAAPIERATLVRQADGPELMVIPNPQTAGPIGTVRLAPLPSVLEATGQVTFDDKLVSTIISRLTGRIEEIRSSQWEMVHTGEPVMKVFSPDFMSAEAEYLASAPDKNQRAANSESGAFDLPISFNVAASLREAAVRKLDLLGFTPADIAAIKTASPTVWVRAPISGIIVSKNAVRGQAVNPGDQLFALATLQRVWITADIYQDDLSRVWVGQNLQATTASFPGEVFKGTVQRIAPALDPNIHTLQLRCQVDNPKSLLKPQMLARVRLATPSRQALVIPQSALVFDDHAYYAFVLNGDDKVERRQVDIAEWNEDGFARVVSGMRPDDKFIATETPRFNAMWHDAHVKAE
jgi:Cu(I)/Ag(I) efflux system membrane fusion protein